MGCFCLIMNYEKERENFEVRKYLRLSLGVLLGGAILYGGNGEAAPAGTAVSNQAEMDATGGTINVTDERAMVLMAKNLIYNGPVSITVNGLPPDLNNYPENPSGSGASYSLAHHAAMSIHNAENFTLGTTTFNYGSEATPINTTMSDAIGIRMSMHGSLSSPHNASFGDNSVFNVYANVQGSDVNGAAVFTIHATGNDSANQEGRGNIVAFGENTKISVENIGQGNAEGMEVYSSTVNFLGDATINATISGTKTDTNGIVSHGIYTRADSHIDVAGTLNITSESSYAAFGMQFMNDSTFRADKLKIKAISNYATPAGKPEPLVVGVFGNRDSSTTFGDSEITVTRNGVDGDGRAIWGANGAQINALEGKHLITGNIIANQQFKDTPGSGGFIYQPVGTTTINVDFGTDSVFTGYARKIDAAAIINLNMLGTTKWDMTDDSTITTLDFQDPDSKVNFIKSDGYSTLTTDVLSGTNGNFFMRTDIQALQGDLLIAKDTGAHGGIHKITVANNGSAAVTGDERLTIVDTTTGNATFELTNVVELGGYQYNLRQVPEDQMDWELFAARSPGVKDPSTPAASVQLFSGAYLLNYAENQTLLKRLGDLRNNERDGKTHWERDDQVWARVFGGKFTSSSDGFLHGFDMNYWGVQAGYDKRIERDDKKGTVYVGGFLGYSKGNLDYLKSGSGSIDSKSLGAYWTHIHYNNFYADVVFKYNWMNSDFKTLDSAGMGVRGNDINTRGFAASLELGRRYFFDKTDDNGEKIPVREREGWYVEPQVQLTLGHQNGGKFTLSNGLNIKSDSFRSVLGRAEVHLGYEVKSGKNPINIYGKLGVMKEFDGEVDYYLNGSPEQTSYGDTWKLWGVGVTAQFKDRHNLYLEVEKATGGQFNQKWGINGGYRYAW